MRKVPTVKAKCLNKGSLYIQVTLPQSGEKRLFKNLHESVDTKYWNGKEVDKKCQDAIRLNKIISDEIHELESAFEQDRKEGKIFTVEYVSQRMKGLYSNPAQDFYKFCEEQISLKKYSAESKRSYRGEITKMKQHTPALAFANITFKWLQSYEHWMRTGTDTRPANHDNTVWKSLKFINTMLNIAVKIGGIIDKNPMTNYDRGKYKQGIPEYLKWDDALKILDAARNKPMTDYCRNVAWRGLLSYFSGLRFADSVSFDYNKQVQEGAKNRLILHTQKTGELVSIGFNKYIAECVEQIKDRPLKITNQEFNRELATICGIAGVPVISSHACRHGFAVHCATLGIGIDEVQKLLGHTKQSTTAIYFKIIPKRLDEAMSRWE